MIVRTLFYCILILSLAGCRHTRTSSLTSLSEEGWIPSWVDSTGSILEHEEDIDLNINHVVIKYSEYSYTSMKSLILSRKYELDNQEKTYLSLTYFKDEGSDLVLSDGYVFFTKDEEKIIVIFGSLRAKGESRYTNAIAKYRERNSK